MMHHGDSSLGLFSANGIYADGCEWVPHWACILMTRGPLLPALYAASSLLLKLFFKIPADESKNPFCLADDFADRGIPLKIAGDDHRKMLCL